MVLVNIRGTFVDMCPCTKADPRRRNRLLQQLRDAGHDIDADLFAPTRKESLPPINDRILGKFRDREALAKAYRCLADRAGLSQKQAGEQLHKLGLVTAYRRLSSNFSKRKVDAT